MCLEMNGMANIIASDNYRVHTTQTLIETSSTALTNYIISLAIEPQRRPPTAVDSRQR